MFVVLELGRSCLATRFGQLFDMFRFQMSGHVPDTMCEVFGLMFET